MWNENWAKTVYKCGKNGSQNKSNINWGPESRQDVDIMYDLISRTAILKFELNHLIQETVSDIHIQTSLSVIRQYFRSAGMRDLCIPAVFTHLELEHIFSNL